MDVHQFRAPLYVGWDVTLKCNAECLHCYSDAGPGRRSGTDISTAEACAVIDQLIDAGVIVLALLGGEPLMREDIFTLIDRAVRGGLLVNIATNGIAITAERAARLRDTGVRTVTVSLDGASAAVHDPIRKRPGLFERAVRAVETLVSHGPKVGVGFTPILCNYKDGPAVVKMAHELGASAINLSEFVPAGRGSREMLLPPEILRDVLLQWIEMRREYEGRIQVLWHDCRVALLVPPEQRNLYTGCGAGKTMARIRVDGSLTPCVFLSDPVGNLLKERFVDVWNNSTALRSIRTREDVRAGNCASCEHKPICGGCRAMSMACYGDLGHGDPNCWLVPEKPSENDDKGRRLPLLS